MPTVIDSLIVTLGLDPKNFNDQQKKTSETWLKTVAGFQKGGKQVEESSKKAAETVNLITRRVLELFAVVTGSQALSEFVRKITNADASLGRFASSLGESPQRLAAWENAADRFGGAADQTASTLERVNKQLYNLNKNGEALPREFSQLQAWTGMRIDPNHGLDRYLSDVTAALQRLHQIDAGAAHNVAQALGIDPATEQLMYKMGAGIDAYLDKLQKSLSPSNAAVESAQKLQASWQELLQNIIALANAIYDRLGPVLVDAANKMTAWIEKNQDWIKTGIVDAVKQFIDFLSKIDWNAVGVGMKNFATDAKDVVDGLGGIVHATEILFGLWLGAKFLRVLANVRLMAAGGAGAGGTAAAAGAGGGLGLLGTLATGVGMLFAGAAAIKWGGAHVRHDLDNRDHGTIGNWVMKHMRQPPGSHPGKDADDRIGVDGKPISKSNPVPVTMADQSSSGGGFWSNLLSGIGAAFGGGGSASSKAGGLVGGMVGGDGPSGPQRASGGTRGWWTPERQSQAYQTLTGGGLSDAGARGLISRWMNVEAAGGPSTVNGVGASGVAQWLGPRKARLMAYAKAHGKNWNDEATQYQFVLSELNGQESRAGSMLRHAKTDAQGATGASMYERAEGYNAWNGMDNFTGKTYRGMRGINTGAKSAALSNISSTHTATTSTSSVENHIGKVEVHSQATDANGVASDINDALNRRLFTAQANSGLA
ncbi:phage tail-type lysozyme domain-containing protein [Mesorhizobium sp. CO1-1-2]|uniref:phage tail tip lysozyme n=1 Tax=Mesorhizobium sp. CO1-1-2 TaxID=2876635 RepID=UPI001CCBE1AE|nr:phage tail tip lysozyme [Mesorhizobium sp. CO1-1-2]MBZ9683204.1 phage tail-type lysozyme domain-containing protein [Mesorhizobium sp. CO1-1-2]